MAIDLVPTPWHIDADRVKHGGLNIPNNAIEQMKEILSEAFEKLDVARSKSGIDLKPFLITHIKNAAGRIEVDVLCSRWVIRSGYIRPRVMQDQKLEWTTYDQVKEDIEKEIAREFDDMKARILRFQGDIPDNHEFHYHFEECKREILGNLKALAAKWK